MKKLKDWREEYYEVEVFTRVQYRHKMLIRVGLHDDVETEAKKILVSYPIEYWADPDNIEGVGDDNDIEIAEDRFEICMINDVNEDGCGHGFKNTIKDLSDAMEIRTEVNRD
tara:strand:- start:581 stop:916 length:336 start_codon:yes stop_codon:yes gene_type:complete